MRKFVSVSGTVNIIIVLSRFLRQQNITVIFYINFRLNRDYGLALLVHSNPLSTSKCSAVGFFESEGGTNMFRYY